MLTISNLHVAVGDKPIQKWLTLDVPAAVAPAFMGPNEAETCASCYDPGRRMP